MRSKLRVEVDVKAWVRWSALGVIAALMSAGALAQTSATKSKSLTEKEAAGDSPADPGPLATGLSSKLDRRDVDAAMKKVAAWQISYAQAKFNQQWTYAPLYEGLLVESHAAKDPASEAAVVKNAEGFKWDLLDDRFPHADDEAIGRTYLALYQEKPDPVKMAATKAIMDRLVARQDDPKKLLWWWCDALYMAPPVMARLSKITGDRKYLDTMDKEWWETYDVLYNKHEDLYFRDETFLQKTEKNGKPLFWSRGNGWVLAGLAQVLELMPKDYPTRPKYEAEFKAMAAKIASLQPADGMWRTGLLDPESYSAGEVSGTAFYTYAMAWGVNNGLLDAKVYKPVVARGWAGMVSHIYASGRLGAIQPIGAAPDSFTASSSYVYGVGGFLLAGSEIDKMKK